jgi:DNA-binding SARP family transcriptional activator
MFRLETLGGLALLDGAGGVVSTQRRRLALLALIAAAGRRGISRDRLLAYLWPESSAGNARHGLEQLLYGLRRQVHASLFVGVDPLRLNQRIVTSDVTEFDEAVDRGDAAAARSLYRGPFLDGFYLGAVGDFETWAEAERARLTQRYAAVLGQSAREASEDGDPRAAIEHWRKLVLLDPLSSHATLGLMTALIDGDEHAEAVRCGRAYEALARAEGADPTPAVLALVRRLVAEGPPTHHRPDAALRPLESNAQQPVAQTVSEPRPRRALATSLVGAILLLALGTYPASRTTTVIATGDPLKDVRAVQAALDGGADTVVMLGDFSFAAPPTKSVDPRLASGWDPADAEIRVSKTVTILGERNDRGEMATIKSGTIPFYIDAPGERVTIRGLRFIRPIHAAILVRAARGLEISFSRIEGLVPLPNGNAGISINTRGDMSLLSGGSNAENVSGHLLIANNEIDGTGGTAQAPTAGVLVISVGRSPDREADIDIVSNRISNMTAPTINIRGVEGSVRLTGNQLRTSTEAVADVDAVRLVNGRSILMANNVVECRWPNAAAIQVYSPFAERPTEQVRVENNEVLMLPSPDVALGDFSAGISIRGFARRNGIRGNIISGRARTALSMYAFRGGAPADNAFIDNLIKGFAATDSVIVIGSGVARAHIVGSGSLSDHGTATIRER